MLATTKALVKALSLLDDPIDLFDRCWGKPEHLLYFLFHIQKYTTVAVAVSKSEVWITGGN